MGRINVNLSIFAGLQSPNSSRLLEKTGVGLAACMHLQRPMCSGCFCGFLLWVVQVCVSRLAFEPKQLGKQVLLFFVSLSLGPCHALSILAEGAIALSVTPSGGAQFAS